MTIEQFLYAYVAKEEHYKDNDYIIREGARGDWIYLVMEGTVKVKKMTAKGLITIDILKEGDIFGEMILWKFGLGTRTASVIADGTVKVGVLDTKALLNDYEKVSPRLKDLMRSLVTRLYEATNNAVSLAVESN